MEKHPLEHFRFCPVCGSAKWTTNNFKSKRCPDCGFIYYGNPSAAVACLLLNAKGELLVCRRANDPAKGTLDLPGGFVDPSESAEEALRREIREELHLEIENPELFTTLPNQYLYSGMELNTLDLIYTANVRDFSRLEASDDVSEAFFAALNTISPDDFGLNSIKKGIIAFLKIKH
jgi:ADP-ribose pyrophosphatase YjhB (NUDIX family)